jgi:PIF1-like helicase/Helitron helicase-like domain at N-terminus
MAGLEELNSAIDNVIFHDTVKDTIHGRVCIICDKFMVRSKQCTINLTSFLKHAKHLQGDNTIPEDLRKQYCFQVSGDKTTTKSLSKCLLSPRSKLIIPAEKRGRKKIMCCQECKSGMQAEKLGAGVLPRFAIANNMAIGTSPPCLQRLNDVELALLSQARFRAHLFSYWGGSHKSIKGWHCFYEVDPNHTAAVLQHVGQFTDSNNIAVVLCGPFTTSQKERVLQKVQVNVEWVLEAFQWLKANNRLYKDTVMPVLMQPIIIDNSQNVESENTDIEIQEEIKVVFPDGSVKMAGCSDGAEFDKALAEIRTKCADSVPFLTSRPSKKILKDYEDENLMRAFPMQFPYGYGYHIDFNFQASQNGYLKHLLSLSIPAFHEADIILVIHNMFERSRALSGSVWRVMGGKEKCDVTEEELNIALTRQFNGLPPGNGPGQSFLESVRSVKKNMAHTNDAAKAARAQFLSLSHHFGCAKLLFTVSFDDALDLRILALSGKEDTFKWISSLGDLPLDDLAEEMDLLNGIRMKYPGICALNFEYLLDIVLDKIVGSGDGTGLFGKLDAYALAVEEQGRKTLHAHILVYIAGWNELLKALHSPRQRVRKAAEKEIIAFVDSVLSTKLLPQAPPIQGCFNCKAAFLEFPTDQELRNLRHRVGSRVAKGVIAKCPACKTVFQADELALKRAVPEAMWDKSEEEIKAYVSLQVLKSTTTDAPPPSNNDIAMVNYKFNHHLGEHTKTCFKKGDECRANLPDKKEHHTHILYSERKYEVFHWTGELQLKPNITIRPERLPQDAYTNSYSKAISWCKAPSNSNASVTVGARATIYASCYSTKGTQKEDTSEYKRMASYVAHRFLEERRDNQLFEGLSRLMGAVIVSTTDHVCAAPMAAYLVRNQSRFRFSVKFQYIPVREVIDLVCNKMDRTNIRMSIIAHDNGCFLNNQALQYLHRPKSREFEGMCLVDFFKDYEVVRTTTKSGKNTVTYDIDDPEHPGYEKQLIRKRNDKNKVLPQISNWVFPDASSFGGNIYTMKEYPLTTSVENYCRAVLCLYHPFRKIEDITFDGSFHKKFLQIFPKQTFPSHIESLLTNVQMFYNTMRLPPRDDPVTENTTPFKGHNDDMSDDESVAEDDDNFFDSAFDILNAGNPSVNAESTPPTNISLTNLRKSGARGCGFYNLPLPKAPLALTVEARDDRTRRSIPMEFVSVLQSTQSGLPGVPSGGVASAPAKRHRPLMNQLMHLTYRNTIRRLDPSLSTTVTEEGSVQQLQVDATGTVLSILQWSRHKPLNFDSEQQLSFQIVTAAFVLTYFDDVDRDDSSNLMMKPGGGRIRSQIRVDFNKEKLKLAKLARLTTQKTLRMFLNGAGGSGKSRVVNEILQYAKDFTSRLGFAFDMRTIIVTAMSGVAATSIGGETLHSAAAFNRKIADDDTSWINARLLIIDEVSFMNTKDVETLDEKLRILMRRQNSLFAGMHILFCGDFRQLEPVVGKALSSPFHGDKKWVQSINCYVELVGLHRFNEDPAWGRILSRIRNATSNQHDIDAINQCSITTISSDSRTIPSDIAFCVYANADRTAINAGIFSNLLQLHYQTTNVIPDHVLVVRADNMMRLKTSGAKVAMGLVDQHYLFEHCGDHQVRAKVNGRKGPFVDPLLKLYHHVPLMLVSNEDVPNGHANGTRVLLEAVILQESIVPDNISIDDLPCRAVDASAVHHLLCSLEGNPSKLFRITPKTLICNTTAPIPGHIAGPIKSSIKFNVSMTQLPLLVNNATTGHKLQGQTKKNLLISVWSKKRNWNYVALSRVKTRQGLYLAKPLPYTTDFSMSLDLQNMTQTLETAKPTVIEWDLNHEQAILTTRTHHSTNTT